MSKAILFVDNGITGTMALFDGTFVNAYFAETPCRTGKRFDTHREQKSVTRLDAKRFWEILQVMKGWTEKEILVVRERPMINPARFHATLSAVRCDEAETLCLEKAGLPWIYCDSQDWQKPLLENFHKGSEALKRESMERGIKLFPQYSELIKKHGDADSLLGAVIFYRKEEVKDGRLLQ